MARVLACLPRHELVEGTHYLTKRFNQAKILEPETGFSPELPAELVQILLYIEEDFAENDNVFRLLGCRNFQYLFFSKAANPNWRESSGPGHVVDESERFMLWQVSD